MFGRKESLSPESRSARQRAKALGLMSYGLGIVQLTRPGSVNRFIGVPDHNPNHAMQRLIGAREIMSGTGILFGENKSGWMWSRVAGDIMDASVVGGVLASGLGTRKRLIPAIIVLAGLMALDARVAMRTGDS